MSVSRVQLPPNSYGRFAAFYDDIRFDRFSLSLAGHIEELISRTNAVRILEMACGTGSLLARLDLPGKKLVGLDLSPEMLAEAKKKCGRSRLVNGSITALPFHQPFDLVLCLYDSMNYLLEEKDLVAVFRETRQLLGEGGTFMFDLNNQLAFEEVWDGGDPYEATGPHGKILIRSRYNRELAIGEADLDVEVDEGGCKVVYTSVHRQRCYPSSTVASLLREAGFGSISMQVMNPFPEEEQFDLAAKDLWSAAISEGSE